MRLKIIQRVKDLRTDEVLEKGTEVERSKDRGLAFISKGVAEEIKEPEDVEVKEPEEVKPKRKRKKKAE